MKPIRGGFPDEFSQEDPRPFVLAALELPNIRKGTEAVQFLVDTGADQTSIHHNDMALLGLAPKEYHPSCTREVTGIGGSRAYGLEDAIINFKGDQPFQITVCVGPVLRKPHEPVLAIPSVLGRDLLGQGRLVVDYVTNEVMLAPHPRARVNDIKGRRRTMARDQFLRYRWRSTRC